MGQTHSNGGHSEMKNFTDSNKGSSIITTKNNENEDKNMSPSERIEIARETINFLTAYPRIRAILVSPHDKTPFEHAWQSSHNYPVSSEKVYNYLLKGGNWGLLHPAGMSIGIDEDNEKIRNAALSLGDTARFNTGTPGHFCDLFLIKDEPVGNIPLIDGAYIRGKGGQNLGPGSIHPNGNIYGSIYLHLVPPVVVTKSELLEVFKPYIKGKEKLSKNDSKPEYKQPLNPYSLTMKDLINVSGFKQSGSKYQGPHPIHGSATGNNFVVDFELNEWYCFRHGTGGGPLQWIAVSTGVFGCEESVPGKIKGDLFWQVIAAAHNRYALSYEKLAKALGSA
ncbi:MAG: hypothetical protein AMDU4_FER2C00010G0001 [Ferroplasma sp. Type II]|nr:MAG: hypothetical protein AMDU4_FER2C00010G0001 [Ferroplasma sp. Type II]